MEMSPTKVTYNTVIKAPPKDCKDAKINAEKVLG